MKIIYKLIVSFFVLLIAPISALAYLPSDPLYPQQDYLEYLNARQAWDLARGKGVVVAVLDSGVDINHPDLKFNIFKNPNEIADDGLDNDNNGYVDDVTGWDFVDNDGDPSPRVKEDSDKFAVNHGTAVSGIIGAVGDNGRGMIGIAHQAKILPIRILDSDGHGFVDDLVRSIDYAVELGADVINLSLVGFESSPLLEKAIERANRSGVVVVAAAGNAEKDSEPVDLDITPAYPACYGDNYDNNIVLAVSSVGSTGVKSSFSNYGTTCVDVSAFGERLSSLSYYNPEAGFNSYYSNNWSGTSFSTAVVSGVAALAKSMDLSLSADSLTDILINSSKEIDSLNPDFIGELGAGRIDALSVVSADYKNGGKLVKLPNSSAVYYLNSHNTRYLFSNENVFFSWYGGDWSDHNVETISQEEFDSYVFGKNITIRPGTNLLKFENSPRIYAVGFGNILYYGSNEVMIKLYGEDYQSKVTVMQNSFESDYIRGYDLDGSFYPDGNLLKYKGSNNVWLIQNGKYRKIIGSAFEDNDFNNDYVIKDVSSEFGISQGQDLDSLENSIYIYRK